MLLASDLHHEALSSLEPVITARPSAFTHLAIAQVRCMQTESMPHLTAACLSAPQRLTCQRGREGARFVVSLPVKLLRSVRGIARADGQVLRGHSHTPVPCAADLPGLQEDDHGLFENRDTVFWLLAPYLSERQATASAIVGATPSGAPPMALVAPTRPSESMS